jgi:acyl carrier protein
MRDSSSFVAPSTESEQKVAEICSGLLGLKEIGSQDDLFALGAHSLLATQIVSRVRAVLGVELTLRDFFEQRTIAGLAQAVERNRQVGQGQPELTIPRLDRKRYQRTLAGSDSTPAQQNP